MLGFCKRGLFKEGSGLLGPSRATVRFRDEPQALQIEKSRTEDGHRPLYRVVFWPYERPCIAFSRDIVDSY